MALFKKIIVLFAIFLHCSGKSTSTPTSPTIPPNIHTVISASASYLDVRNAVDSAMSGDTVIVPSGNVVWSNNLAITKGLTLRGAGVENTIITSNYMGPNANNPLDEENFIINYQPVSPLLNEAFHLTGFTLKLNKKCLGVILRNSTVAKINKIRIDHNKIISPGLPNSTNKRAMVILGTVYGVIDNNTIYDGFICSYGNDADSWKNLIFNFGSEDNIYYEDNSFTIGDCPHASGIGGRYCARYNTYVDSNTKEGLFPWFDMHGNQPVGNCATMGIEIYGNTIIAGLGVRIFDHRGGKALIYNNNVTTSGSVDATTRDEYNDSLNPPASSPISGQPQHISDSYYWRNTKNNTALINAQVSQTVDYGSPLGLIPQENKEFWNENQSFDGTVGLGIGTLENRPLTCVPGVGYWATDKGTLYRCSSVDTWTTYYTPYTYPHPLRTLLKSPFDKKTTKKRVSR